MKVFVAVVKCKWSYLCGELLFYMGVNGAYVHFLCVFMAKWWITLDR